MSRCPWSIRYGTSAETSTQCDKDEHLSQDRIGLMTVERREGEHSGPGLSQFPGQRIVWQAGDRREYTGDWPGYCIALPGPPHGGGGCCLPAGHHGRHAP